MPTSFTNDPVTGESAMSFSIRRLALAITVACSLAACNKAMEKTSPSQVLARVNSSEITVHQLNFLLAHQAADDAHGKQQALENLVDQELLVQRASALKLDRDPNVLQAIEFSRRQILAKAAMDHDIGTPSAPTDAQVDDFYRKNPELFANRKVYAIVLFSVATDKVKPELMKQIDASHTPAETAGILTRAGLKFAQTEAKRAAEEFSIADLKKISAMKDGDILVVEGGSSVSLVQIVGTTAAPIDLDGAKTAIRAFLQRQTRDEVAEARFNGLKSASKIEYLQKLDEAGDTKPARAEATVDDKHLNAGVKGLQ